MIKIDAKNPLKERFLYEVAGNNTAIYQGRVVSIVASYVQLDDATWHHLGDVNILHVFAEPQQTKPPQPPPLSAAETAKPMKPSSKTKIAIVSILLPLLFLVAAGSLQAQQVKTNYIPPIASTVTAAANSNAIAFGNSGGYANPTAWRLPPLATKNGFAISPQFSCATVTLAAVTIVLAPSYDGTTFATQPEQCLIWRNGASAASANNTNVVGFTNFSATTTAGIIALRNVGVTNGNAADITSLKLAVSWIE